MNPGEQVTSIRVNPNKQFASPDFIFPTSQKFHGPNMDIILKERPSFTFDPFFMQVVIMCRKHAVCF